MGNITHKYKNKTNFTCDMCKIPVNRGERFIWKGLITKIQQNICKKCAKREHGPKNKKSLDDMPTC